MGTAIDHVVLLDAVPDDATFAMRTRRSELVDRTFEAVEDIGLARHAYLEGFVVLVSALIAPRHDFILA